MKKLLILILLLSYSCGSPDFSGLDTWGGGYTNQNDLSKILTSLSWKVTLYSNNGVNETTLFSSYIFKFNDDKDKYNYDTGIVNVINGTKKYEGTWAVYLRYLGLDTSGTQLLSADFVNISFISPNELLNINGEWKSVIETNTKIELTKTVDDKTYLMTLEQVNK